MFFFFFFYIEDNLKQLLPVFVPNQSMQIVWSCSQWDKDPVKKLLSLFSFFKINLYYGIS